MSDNAHVQVTPTPRRATRSSASKRVFWSVLQSRFAPIEIQAAKMAVWEKNATERAVVLRPVAVGAGLAFETVERMTAGEYVAAKTSAARATRATERIVLSEEKRRVVRSKADALILEAVRAHPGIVKGKLMAACKGQGAGVDALEVALSALVESGALRTETTGSAVNSPRRHFLADAEPSDP